MIRKNSLSSCSASDGNDNDSVITTSEVDCEVMLGEDFTDDNPTFGNIQVKNSTDIHFGNKTYCQGPVTIKQIVYASPEAHNGAENKNNSIVFDVSNLSKDNLGFVPDNNVSKIKSDSNKNNEEFIERAPTIKGTQWFRNFSPQQTVLIAALVVILLVSLIASTSILLTRDQSEDRGITKYPDDSDEQEQGTPVKYPVDPTVNLTLPDKLKIISRKEWLAQPAFKQINELVLPIPYVVISHTATENCTDQAACTFYIRFLQTYHIESRNYSDIVYNFLVGGDGYAYEGRGWKYEGAHTYGFNSKSLGIAFVGTFNNIMPPDRQILAAKQLIEKGVGLGFVAKNYRLFGERQLQDTKSPGNMLFEDIKTWPHWFKL